MPIYEYQCERCGARREIIVRAGAEPRPRCADCRRRMRRLISPTAFILKGSGWYVTDYPSRERAKALESEKAPAASKEAPAGKKDAAGTEAAPAGKPASAPVASEKRTRPSKRGRT